MWVPDNLVSEPIPTKLTKQAAMESEDKFDMLLRMLEECERRREVSHRWVRHKVMQ